MPGNRDDIDHSLTFAQREGAAPLPRQLELKELPLEVRAQLWALVHRLSIPTDSSWISGWWSNIYRDYWVVGLHQAADEYDTHHASIIGWVKPLLYAKDYVKPLSFIEFVIRHPQCPRDFALLVNAILVRCRAAYRVFGKSIAPISSHEEGVAISRALEVVSSGGYAGATTHLQNAASALTAGRFADSIRESMNAVESVARIYDPNATTLAPALNTLERQGHLHPALKKGFQNLYGFTSDEQGIRHALLEAGDASVTESDALYMFGACANFAGYLVRNIPR